MIGIVINGQLTFVEAKPLITRRTREVATDLAVVFFTIVVFLFLE